MLSFSTICYFVILKNLICLLMPEFYLCCLHHLKHVSAEMPTHQGREINGAKLLDLGQIWGHHEAEAYLARSEYRVFDDLIETRNHCKTTIHNLDKVHKMRQLIVHDATLIDKMADIVAIYDLHKPFHLLYLVNSRHPSV